MDSLPVFEVHTVNNACCAIADEDRGGMKGCYFVQPFCVRDFGDDVSLCFPVARTRIHFPECEDSACRSGSVVIRFHSYKCKDVLLDQGNSQRDIRVGDDVMI
jgi:hypothetical protein